MRIYIFEIQFVIQMKFFERFSDINRDILIQYRINPINICKYSSRYFITYDNFLFNNLYVARVAIDLHPGRVTYL